jgi:hypothetical protein
MPPSGRAAEGRSVIMTCTHSNFPFLVERYIPTNRLRDEPYRRSCTRYGDPTAMRQAGSCRRAGAARRPIILGRLALIATG